MPDSRDEVDISFLPKPPDRAREGADAGKRKWIGIYFECCHTYARLWKNRTGTAYTGHCPSCAAAISVPIGPGGTNSRMFRAG
ncbi:MAG: hypothetical protein AAGD00_10685 [Planctomycetota bacterium]